MNIVKILVEFVVAFVLVYLVYYFFIIKKCKKKKDYVPVEVNLILSIHKIDYKKINLYGMIKVVSLVTTFIIALVVTIINNFFDNTIIILIFSTIVSVLIAIIIYNLIGKHYKKQSMIKKTK